MTTLVLRGGTVVCPRRGTAERRELAIVDGRVAASAPPGAPVVDVSGLTLLPGLVDLACHLRDPGFTHDESLDETLAAARRGGFTSLVALPDTHPVVDRAALVDDLRRRAAIAPAPELFVVGALTASGAGHELAELGEMQAAGTVGFGDVPRAPSLAVLRRALEYASSFHAPVFLFGGDEALEDDGVIAEGAVATRLGLAGIPVEAETVALYARAELARLTGARVFLGFVSSARGLAVVERAHAEGVLVTAAVTPWHLALDEQAHLARPYDTRLRLAPPLRTPADREALVDGVRRGTLVVATQHRGLSPVAKEVEMARAEPGAVALPVALSVLLSHTSLTPLDVARALADGPARFLGLADRGHLDEGARGDVVAVDLGHAHVVDRATLGTPSAACPAVGLECTARVALTVRGGEVVHRASPTAAAAARG